jgi:RNA polymerase sigma-70 factor (ECF subfamily)
LRENPSPSDVAEASPALRLAFEAGLREYGPLPLPFETFADRVLDVSHRRLSSVGVPPSPAQVEEYLSAAAGADLFLAIACDEGVPGAWETFTGRFLPRLFGLARRYGASRSEAEEIARSLPGDLIARPGRGRTRFGTFDGSGNLLTWLKVQVARRLADRAGARRLGSFDVAKGEEGSRVMRGGRPAAADGDPADTLLDGETVALLEEGLWAAWRDLEARERQALLWRFRDGLVLREIAPRMGISVSRASRVLSGAIEAIRDEVLRRLARTDPARVGDRESLWGALRDAVARHFREPQSRVSSADPLRRELSQDGPSSAR